jgi:hypothetical protein
MTDSADLGSTPAYTRQAVEAYLKGVEAQRSELESAIAQARARTARALDLEQRIVLLERQIGERFVIAHARADPRFYEPTPAGGEVPLSGAGEVDRA